MAMESGQNVKSDYDVLEAIQTQLRTITNLDENNCYIIAEPVFLPGMYPGDQFVQIAPGNAIDKQAIAGNGVVQAEVRIAIYKRLLVDRAGQESELIADATNGILTLVETIQNKLTQNYLVGRLVIPMVPLRREVGGGVPAQQSGWARIDRLFMYSHRVTFSAQQQASPP